MMTRIKICGITTPGDARAAVVAGAAAVGLVFAPSPRQVGIEQAQRIIQEVPPFVSAVGVFVNASRAEVLRVLKKCRLDILQFHGDESNLYCAFFRTYCKIIKSLRMRDKESAAAIADYPAADALLLDAFADGAYGGTGKRFSLSLLPPGARLKPLIIAGGITPRNAGEIARRVHPYALDVSSGVEKSPGRKDPRKIRALINSVQREKN